MKKGSIKLSDINFLDPGLQENPYEAYEVLRKEAPVYLSPDTGFFVVSKSISNSAFVGSSIQLLCKTEYTPAAIWGSLSFWT